jgi:protein SCO1/2
MGYTLGMSNLAMPRSGRIRGRVVFFSLVACVVLVVGTTVFLPTVVFPPATPKLDDHGQLPGFSLTDHTGAVLSRESLLGHVTIVNFIFTRCDTVCPVTSMKMRTIQDRTGDVTAIKLLSISIDPAHDTVAALAAYAERFGADATRWRFVRGDIIAVRELVERGMQIGFDDLGGTTPSGAPNITHSGHFVLIDQTGHIRGYYDSDDWPRIERLMKHARYLDRRPPRG